MTVRQSLTFIEIDVSICSLSFGVAPCTATISGDVTQKCFNTIGSCADRAHYAASTVTLRFAKDSGYQSEAGIAYEASNVTGINHSPGRTGLGDGLGQRSSVTVSFRDHPHADTGAAFDKYLSTRAYDPYQQGTFWAKFKARHPNLRGRALRVVSGFLGQSLAQMETRHFIIDSVDGPSLDGTFTITAKDPLKALDDERAQAPAAARGYLSATVSSSGTSATLLPAGIGNSDYPSSGYLSIGGDEIVAFTRSGDTLSMTRAQYGTLAIQHTGGKRCQPCLSFVAQDPGNIIRYLLITYAGISSSLINQSAWNLETSTYSGQVYSTLLVEPVSVRKLVAELCEQAGLALWWDNIAQTLRLQVMRAVTSQISFDETNILAGSLTVIEQPDKRISQVWVYFGIRNPLEDISRPENFYGLSILEDTDVEADHGGAMIKKIFSRWIAAGGRLAAARLTEILLGRYHFAPRKVQFAIVDDEWTEIPAVGAGIAVSAMIIQDASGKRETLGCQIVAVDSKDGRVNIQAEEVNWGEYENPDGGTDIDLTNRYITLDYNAANLDLRSIHDNLWGAPTAGVTVNFTVTAGTLIYASSTSAYAVRTGSWPGDVTLKLTVLGRIQGAAGNGAPGTGPDNTAGVNGSPGGPALLLERALTLLGNGAIKSGGGGGGGGGGDYIGWFGPNMHGGGGGGGGGYVPGNGGGGGSGPGGTAQSGGPGGLDGGGGGGLGVGGDGTQNFNFRGGNGGAPGSAGAASGPSEGLGSSGGAPGYAIVNVGYLTNASSVTISGPTI